MIRSSKNLLGRWPDGVFLFLFMLIAGGFLYYLPSWGLQDDFQSLAIAETVWQSPNFLGGLWDVIMGDFNSWGIFRPVYYSTVVITYHFLKEVPWLIYIFVAGFNFAAMFLWGVVIARIFNVKGSYARITTFLFPLSFLVFTPFWNIFTHISFQEKYIVFFSATALYFLDKAYKREKVIFLVPVMISIILGILSKPTGIYLTMVLIVFAAMDLLFLNYKKRTSWWVLSLNTVLFIFYYWFITINLRGYAGQYSLTLGSIVGNLLSSPLIIKLLIMIAGIMFFSLFVIITHGKNTFSPLALIIPLGFLAYVLILAPWRLVNYLLSALTPYALIMFFPAYIWFNNRSKISKIIVNTCLIILVVASFSFIALPRVAKLADIKMTEDFIVSFNQDDNTYFFPPPFSEAASAISAFTSARVVYLSDGVLSEQELHDTKTSYLIVNDEASGIMLEGVKIGDPVYRNDTWRVFQLIRDSRDKGLFKVDFPENFMTRLKSLLRNLH